MGNLGINIDDIKPQDNNYEPIPRGEYEVWATEAAVKFTKAGTGQYIRLVFEVLEGQYTRRKLFLNLNIKNPSAQAQEIGLGQLSALCKAMGKTGIVDDTEELLNQRVIAHVKVDELGYNGEPENKITHFTPAPGMLKAMAVANKIVAAAKGGEVDTNQSDDIPF